MIGVPGAGRLSWGKEQVSGVTSGNSFAKMAGTTGLEPATSAVTGQRSNQLNYVPRDCAKLVGSA